MRNSISLSATKLFFRHWQHRRFLSSRPRRTPGQGGASEEYHIANAIRRIKELNPSFVVEVINACNVSVAPKLFSASHITRNAPVLLRILTHADLLSKEALRYQMMQAQQYRHGNTNSAAVIALDLQNSEKMHKKSLRKVMNALAGGARLASTNQAVVCGIPNAGKSSFILPLTKGRTLQVKKKKHFHLPKISSTAGWTLATKGHVLEIKGFGNLTLIDTPGLRPRMAQDDIETKAMLIAIGAMEPTKGMVDDKLGEMIVAMLLDALNRHGSFTSDVLLYTQMLGLDTMTEDPMEFLKAFEKTSAAKGVGLINDLVRQCRTGAFGGMVFEQKTSAASLDNDPGLALNRNSTIVCINDEAKRLIEIGEGKAEFTPLSKTTRNKTREKNEVRTPPTRTDSRKERREVMLLPEEQRELKCMKCAGFIKSINHGHSADAEYCGVGHTRVLNWNDHEIRSYFSRMTEAFGSQTSTRIRYLMRDSLACTFAMKYKLRSRRKAYKKFSSNDLGGFPVPNEERPRRFQSDQPVPHRIECTSRAKVDSCRARAEAAKEARRLKGRQELKTG